MVHTQPGQPPDLCSLRRDTTPGRAVPLTVHSVSPYASSLQGPEHVTSGKNAGQPSKVSSDPAKNVSSSKQAGFFSAPGQFLIPQVSSFLAEAPRQSQGQWTDLLLPQRVLHLKQEREVL